MRAGIHANVPTLLRCIIASLVLTMAAVNLKYMGTSLPKNQPPPHSRGGDSPLLSESDSASDVSADPTDAVATTKPVRAKVLSPSRCHALKLNSTAARNGITRVEACEGEQPRLTIFVDPTTCAGRRLSDNATFSSQLRDRFGPLLLRLRLESPDRALLLRPRFDPPRLGRNCSYVYDLAHPLLLAAHGGRTTAHFRLALEVLYDAFHAVDETQNIWPPLLKASVLEVVDPMTFNTAYHLQQCTVPSQYIWRTDNGGTRGSVVREPQLQPWTTTGSLQGPPPEDVAAPSNVVVPTSSPICDGGVPSSGPVETPAYPTGYWAVRRPADGSATALITTRVRVRKLRREPILFLWAPQIDRDWRWVPQGCRRNAKLFGDVGGPSTALVSTLRGKRIAIGGDSQLRALFFGMVNVLSGWEGRCVRNITSVESEPAGCIHNVKGSHRKSISMGTGGATVQVDFVDDLFLDRLGSSRYDGYDAVIVGFAQHPASKEHWTMDRYRASVANKLPHLQRRMQKKSLPIWYAAPQYPYTTQGFPVAVKDWRTDARLMLFNEAAMEIMRGAGIPTIDAFSITTSMSHTSPDQAHFSNFVSAELVRMTLEVIHARLQGDST